MTINKVFCGDSKVEFVNEIEPAKSGKYFEKDESKITGYNRYNNAFV